MSVLLGLTIYVVYACKHFVVVYKLNNIFCCHLTYDVCTQLAISIVFWQLENLGCGDLLTLLALRWQFWCGG